MCVYHNDPCIASMSTIHTIRPLIIHLQTPHELYRPDLRNQDITPRTAHGTNCNGCTVIQTRFCTFHRYTYTTLLSQLRTHPFSPASKHLSLSFSLVALPMMQRSVHRDRNLKLYVQHPGLMLLLALLAALAGGRGALSQADPCVAGEQGAHSSCANVTMHRQTAPA